MFAPTFPWSRASIYSPCRGVGDILASFSWTVRIISIRLGVNDYENAIGITMGRVTEEYPNSLPYRPMVHRDWIFNGYTSMMDAWTLQKWKISCSIYHRVGLYTGKKCLRNKIPCIRITKRLQSRAVDVCVHKSLNWSRNVELAYGTWIGYLYWISRKFWRELCCPIGYHAS